MAVRHPTTGEPLRRVGANGEAVVAIDATVSAPKSVSAVWALASPELRESIEAAQERAVDRALAHACALVSMVRRRVDGQTVVREPAREVLASSWQQSTARAVAGHAPDPQLHSHLLVHGALRSDGRVVAVESRAWMVHQREIGAAYRSQLAHELKTLGFEIERGTGRGRRYFEVSGVPDGLRDRWSSRHRQVSEAIELRLGEKRAALEAQIAAGGPDGASAAQRLDALERSGRLMPAEERRFAISSRAGKGGLATAGDLDREWWETAVEYGFDARSVERLREQGREREFNAPALQAEVLGRLTEFDATFAPREARAVALEAAAELGPERGLAALDELGARGEVLDLADGRQTTRAHRALERQTVAAVVSLGRGRVVAVQEPLVSGEVHRLASELRPGGVELAPEQEEAVRLACGDRQLAVIVGQAGTGKSTAVLAIARAHQQAGRRTVVASTGAQAAERLAGELHDGGVDARGYSTAALRANVESGRLSLDPGVTVLHDEAALASTREQAWLFHTVGASGARLIAIGDPRQSQAVGAGGLWPSLEETARQQDALAELTRIVRARDPADRRDQSLWRSGQHERALRGYEERGLIVLEPERRLAEDRALEGAQADRAAGRRTLVIAETSNEQLDALNARAQAIRLQEGELGVEEMPVTGRPYGLHAGDEFVVRAPIRHPELGPVRNGVGGEVVGVNAPCERAMLRLTDGREGLFDRDLIDAGQVRLAYAAHPFPAQGQTTDTTHVISGPLSSAEGSYVGLTRAREQTHVYAATGELELAPDAGRDQTLTGLAAHLGRSEPEIPSIRVPLAHEQRVQREHERESLPAEGDRETGDLDRLRAERDRLRALVATFPSEVAANVARLEQRAEESMRASRQAAENAEADRLELENMGRRQRRGRQAQAVQARRSSEQARAQEAGESERLVRAEIEGILAGADSPARWESEHPGAREQRGEAEGEFDRAVDEAAARAIEASGEHLVRVLEERPEPERRDERETWDRAAHGVESYRLAHEVDPTEPTALGAEPQLGERESWERRGHWRKAAEGVMDARKQLDIAEPGLGTLEERLARVPGIASEQDLARYRDRGLGRGL